MTTRSTVNCEIFGHPKLMNNRVLPTYCDVLLHYLFIQHDLKDKNNGKNPSVCDILNILVPKIEEIWQTASIPTVSRRRIWDKLKTFHQRYKNIQKNLKCRKDTATIQYKLIAFRKEASNLFDVASCKCNYENCKCEKSKKVPVRERAFLLDQRTNRMMAISTVDTEVSKKIIEADERRAKTLLRLMQNQDVPSCSRNTFGERSSLMSLKSDEDINEDEFEDENEKGKIGPLEASCKFLKLLLYQLVIVCPLLI